MKILKLNFFLAMLLSCTIFAAHKPFCPRIADLPETTDQSLLTLLSNPQFQFDTGVTFEIGRDVEQDYEEAARWYRLAAEQGHAHAQNNLGILYERHLIYGQNADAEAVRWYQRAAELGLSQAQLNLGQMYERGQGMLAHDYTLAVYWYKQAADQGFDEAQLNLGVLYSTGEGGIRRNHGLAFYWFKKAADQGHKEAQFYLAQLLRAGPRGVVKDLHQALHYYKLAKDQGFEQAAIEYEVLQRQLNSAKHEREDNEIESNSKKRKGL